MDPRERLNDPEEASRAALDGRQARIRTAIPGVVVSFDPAKSTVTVQPAIRGSIEGPDGDTTSTNLPVLPDVPVCWPRGGGFALTFPIKPGDECQVIFNDRCIDAWWQSGGIGEPLEPRMHDLSDGMAHFAPSSVPKALANISMTGMQMRNEAGTAYIEITDAGVINIMGAAFNVLAPISTHLGKNIGATHVHLASGGVGLGGVPA